MYEQIAANKRKTFFLILGFVVLLFLVGAAFDLLLRGGVIGLVVVAIIVIVSSVGSYYNSDKAALAISHAKPADKQQYARLYNLVEGLCISGGLPQPRLYIIEDPAPNAFATGRNPKHAAIGAKAAGPEQQAQAENVLTGALKSLFALAEAYPDLKANQNFLALQEELTSTEDRIAYSRQFYNDTVLKYDNKIETIPSNIIAGMFGFKGREYFKAEEGATEVPKVQF